MSTWTTIGEWPQEDMTTRWLISWAPAIGGSSPLAYLWNVGSACLHCSHRLSPRYLPGHSLEIVKWCWDHLERLHDWTQLRLIYKLIWQVSAEIYSSWRSPKTSSYVCSLCLLNLPPTNLEQPASFFSLFLPFADGGHFILNGYDFLSVYIKWHI